jgi:Na+/H+ antiporter NhaD/arsenite permease-like protein
LTSFLPNPPLLNTALWVLGLAAVALANLINNQPMTILLTRACMTKAFAAAASAGGATPPALAHRALQAALFAVVVGSNTAACFSVIGALAGIMWVAICRARGLDVSYARFTALMAPAGAAATAAALLVLTAEFELAPLSVAE